jgi:glycosyltransferase involved in cell wall biosynthesis
MKILFVHERLGAWGGAEVNLLASARELKHRGHEVGLAHGASTGREEPVWTQTFEERYDLGSGERGALDAALKEFEPDVVYAHKVSAMGVVEGLAHCATPVVRMVHDHDLYCMRSYKYHPMTRKICARPVSWRCLVPCGAFLARKPSGWWPLRWVSYRAKKRELRCNRRFARLIVGSQYMREELLRNGFNEEQIEVLPPVPQAAKEEAASRFSDRNLVVYAGQVIRGKGVDVLLDALAEVNIPFECVIAGDGNHLVYCRNKCRELRLEDRVKFLGFVSQEKLSEYYREASVAVMSSVWPEPFGAVGLEAMRHGVPVVAFDAGAIREWLVSAYNGFLVPWMDRLELAWHIQQLLKDKSLAQQMGLRGQRLVAKKFDFGNYISALERVLEEVVLGKGRARERMAA